MAAPAPYNVSKHWAGPWNALPGRDDAAARTARASADSQALRRTLSRPGMTDQQKAVAVHDLLDTIEQQNIVRQYSPRTITARGGKRRRTNRKSRKNRKSHRRNRK